MPVGCVAGRPAGCPASGSLPVVPVRSVLFPAFGGAGEVMEHAFHIFRMELFFQFGGRVQRLDAAVHHDRDPVAVFRFVHIVCGDEDRDPAVGSVVDQFPKLPSCGGVDSSGRLVEENDLRLVENRHRKGQFLFPSQRQGAYQCVTFLFEAERMEQRVGFGGDFVRFHAVNTAEQTDILPHLQVFVKREFLAHIADVALDLFAFARDVVAGHESFARARFAQAAKHPHRGGLAGSVSAEKSEDFTRGHTEADAVDCRKTAETFGQFLSPDDGFVAGCESRARPEIVFCRVHIALYLFAGCGSCFPGGSCVPEM